SLSYYITRSDAEHDGYENAEYRVVYRKFLSFGPEEGAVDAANPEGLKVGISTSGSTGYVLVAPPYGNFGWNYCRTEAKNEQGEWVSYSSGFGAIGTASNTAVSVAVSSAAPEVRLRYVQYEASIEPPTAVSDAPQVFKAKTFSSGRVLTVTSPDASAGWVYYGVQYSVDDGATWVYVGNAASTRPYNNSAGAAAWDLSIGVINTNFVEEGASTSQRFYKQISTNYSGAADTGKILFRSVYLPIKAAEQSIYPAEAADGALGIGYFNDTKVNQIAAYWGYPQLTAPAAKPGWAFGYFEYKNKEGSWQAVPSGIAYLQADGSWGPGSTMGYTPFYAGYAYVYSREDNAGVEYRARYFTATDNTDPQYKGNVLDVGQHLLAANSYSTTTTNVRVKFTIPEGKAFAGIDYHYTNPAGAEQNATAATATAYLDENGAPTGEYYATLTFFNGDVAFELKFAEIHLEANSYDGDNEGVLAGTARKTFMPDNNIYTPANTGRYQLTAEPTEEYLFVKWQSRTSEDGDWTDANIPTAANIFAAYTAVPTVETWYRAVFARYTSEFESIEGNEAVSSTDNGGNRDVEIIGEGKILYFAFATTASGTNDRWFLKAIPEEGYVAAGFKYKANNNTTGTWTTPAATISPASSIVSMSQLQTLYGGMAGTGSKTTFWKAVQANFYEVDFHENGTTKGTAQLLIDYQGRPILRAAPAAGYVLGGWYYKKAGDSAWTLDKDLTAASGASANIDPVDG
ncbi:MAG: hypothetical protein LBS85_07960, partial [Clostridiales Family XIII bacterium]|nr:hypothetical protein [Clostridiales Family XIII bacterium]